MTVIRPSSISGINSITANGGDINLFRADGTKADVPIVNNITAGVVTATKFVGPIEGNVTGNLSGGTINATSGTITGNLGVGGVLTYEDVTNIDSVGIITARSTVSIADSIIHTGDTNTSLRFPAADTITAETGGSERVRITSGGSVLVGKTNTSLTTDGIRVDSNAAMITASSTSTNQATANGGSLYLINSSATDNNFSHIGGYNSNGLVTSQINFVNTSHSSRTGDISFRTHDGSSMPERMRISSQGYVTKPNTPVFHAYGNNSWTQYTGSDNLIKLLNSECNIGGHYKQSGTDEGKFVVPVNGTYYFYTTIYSGRSDNGQTDNNDYLAIYFYEDGNNLANKGGHHIRHYYNEGDRDSTSSMSYIRTCTAGEKFYVSITCNGTGYQVYGGHSAFGGYLIG